MDTPHNTLTFCAQQAKCFGKNVLRNKNRLSIWIIHTYLASCYRILNKCTGTQDMSIFRTWAFQCESLCTHCIMGRQHLEACSRPHTHGLHRGPTIWRQTQADLLPRDWRQLKWQFRRKWTVSQQCREICTVLRDATMGNRVEIYLPPPPLAVGY
jgi:hypothetical protein